MTQMAKSMKIPIEADAIQYVLASMQAPGTRGFQYLSTGLHMKMAPKNPYNPAPRSTTKKAQHSHRAQRSWKSRKY